MSNRANVVSAIPIRFTPASLLLPGLADLLGPLDPLELLVELDPLRDPSHDLAGAVEVPLELRETDDAGVREAVLRALLPDPLLVVHLVEPEGDHVGPDLVEDLVDVPLVPEEGPVHGLERADHLQAVRLGRDRRVLEPLRGRVTGHDDDELVPELPRLPQEGDVPGVKKVEHPCRHYPDHACHASMTSCPSRKTRFLSRAYSFASSFDRARPSSPIISQIVAEGIRPAIVTSAVASSVWPRRSASRRSAAFSRGTWPGDRNSRPRASIPQPFSRRSASPTRAAKRAIVLARSRSVIPVRVSRWLIEIEKGDAMGSYGAEVARVRARTGWRAAASP